MYFRQYSDNPATLKEWSKQLTITTHGQYPLYSTVNNTLNHWKNELNKTIETNTFGLSNSEDSTIKNWQDKLNEIYNI